MQPTAVVTSRFVLRPGLLFVDLLLSQYIASYHAGVSRGRGRRPPIPYRSANAIPKRVLRSCVLELCELREDVGSSASMPSPEQGKTMTQGLQVTALLGSVVFGLVASCLFQAFLSTMRVITKGPQSC